MTFYAASMLLILGNDLTGSQRRGGSTIHRGGVPDVQMEVQSSPSTFARSRFAQEHLASLPGLIHGAPAFADGTTDAHWWRTDQARDLLWPSELPDVVDVVERGVAGQKRRECVLCSRGGNLDGNRERIVESLRGF